MASIIVEDGSLVPGANSFVSVAEAKAYAQARKEPFPADDGDIESLLMHAMDFLETYRRLFTGQKASATQKTLYPRIDSTVDGLPFPSDAIPDELKNAQMQLAVDCYSIGDLQPTTTGYAVAKEKVDFIEVEYASGGRLSGQAPPAQPAFPKAEAWLESLVTAGGSGAFLSTVRV